MTCGLDNEKSTQRIEDVGRAVERLNRFAVATVQNAGVTLDSYDMFASRRGRSVPVVVTHTVAAN